MHPMKLLVLEDGRGTAVLLGQVLRPQRGSGWEAVRSSAVPAGGAASAGGPPFALKCLGFLSLLRTLYVSAQVWRVGG